MSAKRNYERPTEVQIFARLANFGPQPIAPDVQLTVDGRVRTLAGTNARCRSAGPSRKRRQVRAEGQRRVHDRDDTAAVVKVEQMLRRRPSGRGRRGRWSCRRPRIWRCCSSARGIISSRWRCGSLSLQDPQQMLPAAYETQKPDKYDVIIFDRYSAEAPPARGEFRLLRRSPAGTRRSPATRPSTSRRRKAKKKVIRRDRLEARSPDPARTSRWAAHGFADPIKLEVPPEPRC